MPTSPNGCFKKGPLKPVFETVLKSISDHNMLRSGDRVLAAVSGGPDSVALVNLLNELAAHLSITLGIAHLNHRLRPEAEDEARFVEDLAGELSLPFYIDSQDVAAYRRRCGLSLEEAAREVRYAFYKRVLAAQGYQKVALGHHSEDNAEMVLMNLLRGSGPLGLSGIPPVRETIIVRPLINLTRAQIRTYLDHRGLGCVLDSSNADTRFTRNRVRHTLVPLLQAKFNPNILAALHRTAAITGDENEWLESLVDPLCDRIIISCEPQQVNLNATALSELPRAPRRRVIRRAVALLRENLRRVTFAHIEALEQLAASENENARVDLPGLITVVRRKNRLILKTMDAPRQPLEKDRSPVTYRYLIETSQVADQAHFTLEIAETGGRITFQRKAADADIATGDSGQQTAFFDIDQLRFPLLVRNYQPGDRFTPLGMHGSKKLKKLFNEHRMRRFDRVRCPVMVSKNEIVWVPGLQRADACKISRRTRQVLVAKYALPDEK